MMAGTSVFSPLALTSTLPFLPLSQDGIDYEVDRRGEPGLIPRLLGEASTRVMLVNDGRLAVPRGQGELVDYQAVRMRLVLLPGRYLLPELAGHPEAGVIFLGSRVRGPRQRYVAVDITRAAAGTAVPDAAHVAADDAFEEPDDEAGGRGPHAGMIDQAARRFDWVDLRGFAPHASAVECALATMAVSVSRWHNSQRHCPCCGAPVDAAMAGWAQRCSNERDGRRILFPRVEPAVITAIVDHDDRLLLQHNTGWRDGFYSVCAGFVEAGENLEHAARREASEEVGLTLGELRYLGSQPWPFPASLMVAFKGLAQGGLIRVDGRETEQARWVTRDELTAGVTDGRIEIPGRASIARYMVKQWYGSAL